VSSLGALLNRIRADETGTTLIETAVVAPVLVIMASGTFETSAMVARQS
jgi:Flp pilus assembly protein TadG